MAEQMKGITVCGDCVYYSMKKHSCTRGCTDEGDARAHFYVDCPLPDVVPVVKAYWNGEGDGYADGEMVYDVWICSNCGYTVDEGDCEPPQYNYCPNCGARMKDGDGDD